MIVVLPDEYKYFFTVSKLAVALPEVWNDPLEDFVALRMNMFSAPARQTGTLQETEGF